MIHVESQATINAPPATVYSIIADYRVAHNAILPRPFFQSMDVEKGGFGAGTVVLLRTKMMGQILEMRQIVSEPEPGRIIQEKDFDGDLVTRFVFDPVNNGQQTRLTISTDFPVSKGIKGLFERFLIPTMFPPVYQQELENISAYVAKQQTAANAT